MNPLNELDGPRSGESAQNLNPNKDNGNFAQELIKHVESLASSSIPHEEILDSLLEKIKPVDFRQLAELEESNKLTEAHYLVITVEEVIRIARAHCWGMAKEAVFTY